MSAISEKVLTIDALLKEHRVIEPPSTFRARALVKDARVYEEADRDFEEEIRSLATTRHEE